MDRRALFSLWLAGCSGNLSASYGTTWPIKKGETRVFADGLEVRVEDLAETCPPPVVCAQPGYVILILRVKIGATSRELQLSQVGARVGSAGPYTFRFVYPEPSMPSLTVEKSAPGP